jgi:hypothetical protein
MSENSGEMTGNLGKRYRWHDELDANSPVRRMWRTRYGRRLCVLPRVQQVAMRVRVPRLWRTGQ